jgi:enoyl-[acyl-carrier protein] reductase III
MTPIKEKTALITGGSRGIGRAIAVMLAYNSARKIFINYVQNTQEAEKTKSMAEEAGCEAILLKYNLAYPDEIDIMFSEIAKHTNNIDVFIHCAAINSFKPVSKITPKQWDLIMNVNARSFLYCTQKCLPVMEKGSIAAISSLGSRRFMPNYGSLSETKSALETLVRDLGVELAPRGIRVNGITAGLVQTESLSNFPDSKKLISTVVEKTPIGRIGTPEDIANAVKFLVSPQAEWIIGQSIVIDGGYSL